MVADVHGALHSTEVAFALATPPSLVLIRHVVKIEPENRVTTPV